MSLYVWSFLSFQTRPSFSSDLFTAAMSPGACFVHPNISVPERPNSLSVVAVRCVLSSMRLMASRAFIITCAALILFRSSMLMPSFSKDAMASALPSFAATMFLERNFTAVMPALASMPYRFH